MEEDGTPAPRGHAIGEDLSRLSVRELEALKAALAREIERVDREIGEKSATRAAADSLFRT